MTIQLPTHIDIDLSSKCNLRCRFCHLTCFNPKEVSELSLADITLLTPLFESLKSITLFGKYEPLTCKEFLPIFNKITAYGIETYFSTNGTLFDDRIIEAICGKLKYLTVSITGFTKDSYIYNMGKDKLARVTDNIKEINRIKDRLQTPYPILRISTVGLLDMLDELPLAIDFAQAVNAAEGIQVTSFKAFTSELKQLMPLNDIDLFTRKTEAAKAYAKSKNVKFVLQSESIDLNKDKTQELGHKPCDMPWHRLSIQSNGDIYPCPVAYAPIGNLKNDDIIDLWNSSTMITFREGVNTSPPRNQDCLQCTHCRHRSTTNVQVNDYSEANTYIAGMTRK